MLLNSHSSISLNHYTCTFIHIIFPCYLTPSRLGSMRQHHATNLWRTAGHSGAKATLVAAVLRAVGRDGSGARPFLCQTIAAAPPKARHPVLHPPLPPRDPRCLQAAGRADSCCYLLPASGVRFVGGTSKKLCPHQLLTRHLFSTTVRTLVLSLCSWSHQALQ